MGTITIAAQLACTEIYDTNSLAFDKIYRVGETVCGRAMVDGVLYIVNQGTVDLAGWEADFDADPIYNPILGNVHCGFDMNLPALVNQLLPDIPKGIPVIVSGHSKGAGEGAILAARLRLAGVNVVQAILFACPNAGYQRLSDWLADNISGISFRNASTEFPETGDPIPMLPDAPFKPPYPHTMLDVLPDGIEYLLGPVWHRAALYLQGAIAWDITQRLPTNT